MGIACTAATVHTASIVRTATTVRTAVTTHAAGTVRPAVTVHTAAIECTADIIRTAVQRVGGSYVGFIVVKNAEIPLGTADIDVKSYTKNARAWPSRR